VQATSRKQPSAARGSSIEAETLGEQGALYRCTSIDGQLGELKKLYAGSENHSPHEF